MTTTFSDHSKLETKSEKLRFDPTSPVVYERWLKAQYAQAGVLHGIYATIFLTGLRHRPPMPPQPVDYETMNADNLDKVLFLRRISTYANAHELSNTADQKLFGQMWANMSEDSLNRVARVHPVDQHILICTQMDAQALLARIRIAHQGAGATIPSLNWDAASTTFYSVTQGPTEEITEYKQRFDAALRTMDVKGHPGIPNQVLQAARFLNGLERRKYRNFLSLVENEAISGAAVYPATLDNAFSRAVNFRIPPGDHHRAPKFELAPPPSVALVADTNPRSRPLRQKKAASEKSPRPSSPPSSKPSPTGAGSKLGYKYKPCKICGEATHFMDRCPMADEMVAKFKRTTLQSVHFAREGGDDYDDDTEAYSFAVTLTVDINEDFDDMIFLDTGASKGIFGNASLLTDVA